MRKTAIILFFILTLLPLRDSYAQSPAIDTGLGYLYSTQNPDRSWGGEGGSVGTVASTVTVLQTLQLLGQTDRYEYLGSLSWLQAQGLDTTENLSERILTLTAGGADSDKLLSYIDRLMNAWGGYDDYGVSIIDTVYAIQALKTINYSDATVFAAALNFLTANQNADGSWGFYKGDTGNIYVTSLVLNVLSQFKSTYSGLQPSANKAVSYILPKQNSDGGFGSSPSTIHETALAYEALVMSGADVSTSIPLAIGYLNGHQQANGSWNNDAYATALALQALNNVKANLSVSTSDIVFSDTKLTVGKRITITAVVKNTGMVAADQVTVHIFDDDPSKGTAPFYSQIIGSIASGGTVTLSVPYTVSGNGSHSCVVWVDPQNKIPEVTKADNIASKSFWAATWPDVAVFSEDISPSTSSPAPGAPFDISFKIRNLGETEAYPVNTALYDVDPAAGGTPIAYGMITTVKPGEVRGNVIIGAVLNTTGVHTLYIVANYDDQVQESTKTNNTASFTVNVGGAVPRIDLVVSQADLSIAPRRPYTGDTVQIAAHVSNTGSDAAFGFTIEFFDGAPSAQGQLIASQTLSLAAGAEQNVTANWTIPSGIHTVYAVVDRANAIAETNELNNQASITVMADMVDISISATDLSFDPSHPVSGDSVTLNITTRNTGIVNTGAFSLALYDGDPSTGSGQVPAGVLLQTFPIANIPGDGSATVTYSYTAVPKTYRFYAVADTENIVTEMYEDNNTAIRSLKIKAPGETLGPDLVPIKIDLTDTITDPQTLAISGNAHVTFQNKGDDKITSSFNVLIFEDKNNDGRYTSGVDNLLGTSTYVTGPTTSIPAIWPEGAGMVNVPLSGTVKFLHSPLYAFVDSGDAILEQDETNNVFISCTDCQVVPSNPIQPALKWKWPSGNWPCGKEVLSQPVIAPLIDTNGDGKIDEKDDPFILFFTFDENMPGCGSGASTSIRAVNGKTGQELFAIHSTTGNGHLTYFGGAYLAVGDINNDGAPEILTTTYSSNLVAFKNDGTLLWENSQQISSWNQAHDWPLASQYQVSVGQVTPISIADIDADGLPDIVAGVAVFNGDGSVKWGYPVYYSYLGQGYPGTGRGFSSDYTVTVADINLDGKQEILAGNTVYNSDGTITWWNKSLDDGFSMAVNLNDDPYPEILYGTRNSQTGARIYLLDYTGKIIWGPVYVRNLEPTAPAYVKPENFIIADFDGDNETEIGIFGYHDYFILNRDGVLKNTIPMPCYTCSPVQVPLSTSPTVFDLNGDGSPELLSNTGLAFTIQDAKNGSVLYQEPFGESTRNYYASVIVSDVDNDGHAELVVFGRSSTQQAGLSVYKAQNNNWVGSRTIWNEVLYHVTNVNDNGSIPQYESPSWLLNNTDQCQAPTAPVSNPYLTPNLTASYLRAAQNSAGVHFTVRIGNGGAKEAPAGIPVTFFDGSPSGSGRVIGSAATSTVLQPGDYEDVSMSWTGGTAGPHDIYAVVNYASAISECRTDDNQAMLTVTIQGAGAVFGPDLVPLRLDTSALVTNPSILSITGTARVTLQNKGDATVATAFHVVVFEDSDNDGRYTSGVDRTLGTGTNTLTLLPNGANIVNVPISGNVVFLSAPLLVMVDSADVVMEQNEGNNVLRAAAACEVRPSSPIQPVAKWTKTGGTIPVMPVIANLTDSNGDGKIDNNDVPSIIYTTAESAANSYRSELFAIDGRTGNTLFVVSPVNDTVPGYGLIGGGPPAVGDIDGDGLSEIVIPKRAISGLLAYSNTGVLKWDNSAQVAAWNSTHWPYRATIHEAAAPVIADIDGDGIPEIIVGATVINNDGSIRWVGKDMYTSMGTGQFYYGSYASIVADLDLDGNQEIIAGHTAYNSDGTIKWNVNLPDGLNAIGNFDGDPYPEIVLVTGRPFSVYLLEHDGKIKWGPVAVDDFWSPPLVADFDGDGENEIGVRTLNSYYILDKNGNLKKTLNIPHDWNGYVGNSNHSAPAVFDLNGDGRPEVLFNSSNYFRIFDGKEGTLLYEESFKSTNPLQGVIIADVDNDGQAEAVLTGYGFAGNNAVIKVYGSKNHDWVGARGIWNQFSYHVTNVNDDGTIPRHEAPSWLVNNTYRCQASTGLASSPTGTSYATPNLTASYFRATYDGSDLNLLVRVGNSGAADAPSSTVITFYDGAPETNTIVGTVPLSKVLRPGDYEDVAYSIGSASPGVHLLYAVVDSANAVSECNKNDNQVQLDYTVQDTLPDLKIGFEDISMPTRTIYEGNLVPITVLVRNIGAISASNVVVRMYNGSPSTGAGQVPGGVQIGTDQVIPAISSSGTATLVFTYDTLGHSGTSILYFVVDPTNALSETNEANNSASLTVNVEPPALPDLAVTIGDIQIAPASAVEGDSVVITTTVMNRGTAIGNIPVRIAVRSGEFGAGSEVYSETKTVYPVLDLGRTATIQTVWNTTGWAGQYAVSVTIDPSNTIVESSKENNVASRPVFIQSAGLSSSMSLDKPSYLENDTVTSVITAVNATSLARTLSLNLAVSDTSGNLIATIVSADPVTIGPNSSMAVTKTWNTGKTLAGPYTMTSALSESGSVISRTSAGFGITADKMLSAKVTTDKISYNPNQNAALTAVVASQSQNYIYGKLSLSLTVTGPTGTVLYSDTRSVSTLMPQATYTFTDNWNTAANPAGNYTVTLTVQDGSGASIGTSSTSFTIIGASASGAGLTGTITAAPATVNQNTDETITFTITNNGNEGIASLTARVLIVNPDTQQVLQTYDNTAVLPIGQTVPGSTTATTGTLAPRVYLAVLQAVMPDMAQPKTLSSAIFTVLDTTPPVLTLSTLLDGSYTNNPILNVAGTASDANGIQSVVVSGQTVSTSTSDNVNYTFSQAIGLAAGSNRIETVATDNAGLITKDTRTIILDQNAPIITIINPGDGSVVSNPSVSVIGTVDKTATILISLNSDPSVTAATDATFFSLPITLATNTNNTIYVYATDLAGNPGTAKRSVKHDDTNPALAITVPSQDMGTNQATITISGTVSDLTNVTLLAACPTASVGAVVSTPTGTTWSVDITNMQQGTNAVTVKATDEAGNSTSVIRNIIYSSTPVTIDPVTTPTIIDHQTVTGTMELNSTVTVICSTATVTAISYPTTTTWQADITGMHVGDNIISVTATDLEGKPSNPVTAKITLTDLCADMATRCNDNNVCTDDSCDSATGACVHVNNLLSCDDGNACTTNDMCTNGVCAGAPVVCNDNNVCTDDVCVAGVCQHNANTASCNDGDPCTIGDVCANKVCHGTPMNCNDNNVCTDDVCVAGVCQHNANTATCNDGDPCTTGDVCANKACHGTPIVCNDNNACTTDACVNGACVYTPVSGGACNDGNACTTNDTCVSGVCKGTPIVCNDNNACTTDACVNGVCVYTPISGGACDDGNACTTNDTCVSGVCKGTPTGCIPQNLGVFGATGITMSGGYIDSYDSTQGAYNGVHGSNVSIGTNSTASGAITLSGGVVDYGNAYVGPGGNPANVIISSGGAIIYGTKGALNVLKNMTPMSDPGGGTSVSFNNGTTLTSGTYRVSSINLSGSGKGTINGNVILIVTGSINLSGTSQIVILPGASLTVYLKGSLNVSGGSIVNQTLNPHKLTIYGTSTCTSASYSGTSALYGAIYTPAAGTAISGTVNVYGSVIGRSVTISGGAAVHYDASLGNVGN